jgi:DNA-3-methyladenine glycosylase
VELLPKQKLTVKLKKGCHAYNKRKTERTKIMFDAGGLAYVYLCYGMHHLFNIVTGSKDVAQAVLFGPSIQQ